MSSSPRLSVLSRTTSLGLVLAWLERLCNRHTVLESGTVGLQGGVSVIYHRVDSFYKIHIVVLGRRRSISGRSRRRAYLDLARLASELTRVM